MIYEWYEDKKVFLPVQLDQSISHQMLIDLCERYSNYKDTHKTSKKKVELDDVI